MRHTNNIIRMAREWLPKAYRDGDVGDEPKFTKHNMEVAFAAGATAEREACAEVCDSEATIEGIAQRCAAAIRARGQA
jgi:predicted metal-dependent phosphoesterase TrpH